MKYKFIGIREQLLIGFRNPKVYYEGTVLLENPIFILELDGKGTEFNCLIDNCEFRIEKKIEIKNKYIKLYVMKGKEKILVSTLKNNVLHRMMYRLKNNFMMKIIKKMIKTIKNLFYMLYKGVRLAWREHHFLIPISMWKKYFKAFIEKLRNINQDSIFYDPMAIKDYNMWLACNEKEYTIEKFKYNPLISVLIPVYNIEEKYLSECLDSILNQTYQNFEICLVDDASTKEETLRTLEEYSKKDNRIRVKYRKENGHISRTSNDALEMAKGEFVALVDNDDVISPNALYENVKLLNNDRKIDFIYSDEDKLNFSGERCYPHFKPDFSPDTLMSLNYICHLSVIRKEIIEKVGGFEVGLEGAQDHDLFLKISEVTDKIEHISKILYHWRMTKNSTASKLNNKAYANDKGKLAIENALKRRKLNGIVRKDEVSTYYIVDYKVKKDPLISIIIPIRDYPDVLKTCLESLYEKTTYKNYEIIVVNNNSKEKETFDLLDKYKEKYDNFRVIDANMEFNYSKINNIAVKESKGEYIVLLNNDTEIITPTWLTEMLGYASLKHIGAVGPKLLYPDTTVQHGGVILGLGGVASHAYTGNSRNSTGLYGRLRVPYNYSAVTAACLMISKEKFYEVGGLEEELKVAYNDMDFNIKLLEKGYKNIFLPQVELFHFESKSRGLDTTTEKYKRFLEESNYMYSKWSKYINDDRLYNSNYSKKLWFMLPKRVEVNDEKK